MHCIVVARFPHLLCVVSVQILTSDMNIIERLMRFLLLFVSATEPPSWTEPIIRRMGKLFFRARFLFHWERGADNAVLLTLTDTLEEMLHDSDVKKMSRIYNSKSE